MSKKTPKIDKFFKEEFKIMQETMPAIWYDVKLKILEFTKLHVNSALDKTDSSIKKIKNKYK